MLINKAYVANSSRKAVHIVRGTILRIGHARRTAGDTVSALGPGPPHSVANRDVECVWHKHIAVLTHLDIENCARRRSDASHGRLAVFIKNAESRRSVLLRW